MKLLIRGLFIVFITFLSGTAFTQVPLLQNPFIQNSPDSSKNKYYDVTFFDTDSVFYDTTYNDVETEAEQSNTNDKEEINQPDWGKRSFWATFADVIATVLGIFAALITLLWMHRNSQKDNVNVQKEIKLLEDGNDRAKQQIIVQERALKKSADQSRKLNSALKSNVEDIKKYLTQSDLKVKLIEKKDTIYSTFSYLYNSSFVQEASKIKDGSIIRNQAVLQGVITIVTDITTFKDLHPTLSSNYDIYSQRCLDDMEQLSKKKQKGFDLVRWLKETKIHFEELKQEMESCIGSLK